MNAAPTFQTWNSPARILTFVPRQYPASDPIAAEWADAEAISTAAHDAPVGVQGMATSWGTLVFTGDARWGMVQSLAAGCADHLLAEGFDVHLVFDHGGLPLAAMRKDEPSSMRVWSDEEGLKFAAVRSPGCVWSADVFRAVADGRLFECSFAFTSDEYVERKFEPTGPENAEWEGAPYVEHTKLARIYDLSVVRFGRNTVTNVAAQAMSWGIAEGILPERFADDEDDMADNEDEEMADEEDEMADDDEMKDEEHSLPMFAPRPRPRPFLPVG